MASSSQISIACSSDERPKEPDALKEQAIALGHPREAVGQSSFFGSERDPPIYLPNLFVPDSQTGYHKGYENFHGDLDDFPLYGHNEELNSKTPGMYNHYASPGFHNGFGYNKQMSCGSYNPAATSLFGGDALFEPNFFVTVDHRADPVFQRSQLDGTSSLCSPGRGNYPGKPVGHNFLDQQRVCEGSRSSSIWSDWSKPLDGHHPFSLASQQSRFSSLGSCSLSYMDKAHAHELDQVGIAGNAGYKFGSNVGSCPGLNYGRHFGLGNGSVCSCSSANEIFNEHNRGPRSSKAKRQMLPESYLWIDSNRQIPSSGKIRNASYNKPDLIIEDAKFFVIKSYSEDNIHKSIKYGVWASTPHGNQKLNSAYQEAKEKPNNCSIFLLFSVNASAQFCGVAEMVGPVDFEKSVDYWQQDKWSGQFPVKWHIIKDVPNSQFRHIVLENNDNKPVTNSRDTQEVKLEQGVEMLNIFKNYETNISILDDFDFYEDRQKALQERKSKEHLSMPVTVMDAGTEKRNLGMESNELIEKMSKSFAQVVRLKECSKNSITAARS